MTLTTCPRIDLCQQPCYIPDQCKMPLKLALNNSSFVLMSDKNDTKYALKNHSCKCAVGRVNPIHDMCHFMIVTKKTIALRH